MTKLSGAEMVIRSLQEEGVEYLFGYPGGSVLHIYDAIFQQNKVQHILVRHEQAATHAADGYARATGKPGVCLVTSGPGATNTITGIATAYMDSIPLIVISGQVPSDVIGEDAFQETDMIGCSRPVVKHSFLIKHPTEIPMAFKKAFHIATTGRPGPVVIDIPKDMTAPSEQFEYKYPATVRMRSYNPTVRGHAGQIKRAADLLMKAKRPVIYAGGGIIQGNAWEPLRELARLTGYPVTNTLMGLGAFPGSDHQFIGMLGMHGTYEANMAMHHADVIIGLGARFDDRVTNDTGKFCPQAKIIHVDIDPSSISKTIETDIPIVGPVDTVIADLLGVIAEKHLKPDAKAVEAWWKQIDEWRQHHGLRFDEDECEQIKPQRVIRALYEVTQGKAYVTSDVGQHQMFAAQHYAFDDPRKWINSGGLGTMGFGLPAAMGVQFAHPGAPVACVTGEGSIQMCIQELSTCLQYQLPIKIVNINNQALGMVRQWQDMQYGGRHSESYMQSLPDFVKLAEAYGHIGIKVTDRKDLEPALKDAFGKYKDRLVFLDIYVDRTEHVYPMQIKGGSMRDMWLSKTERT